MTRYTDIELFLRACEHTPFQWGLHDCCTLAADAVLVQVGRDPMAALRGYRDEKAAAEVIEQGGGLRALVTAALGTEILPALAQRGDVVLYESGNGPGLGVCAGSKFAVVTEAGLGYCNMRRAIAAWRAK